VSAATRPPRPTLHALRSTLLLLAALAALAAARLVSGSEERIGRFLGDALAAKTDAEAEAKFQEAEALLKSARDRLDPIEADFLAADIARSRGQRAWTEWQKDPKAPKAELHDKARELLTSALRDYDRLREACQKKIDEIEEQAGDKDVTKDSKWIKASNSLSRARYQVAWQQYRLGDLSDKETEAEARAGRFEKALEQFGVFTEGKQFTHPVVLDCLLGQCLSQYELKRYAPLIESLETDFKILGQLRGGVRDKTRWAILKRMMYLLIKAHDGTAAGSPSPKLEAAASLYFDAMPFGYSPDALDLELALIRARNLAALLRADDAETGGLPAIRQRNAPAYTATLKQIEDMLELVGDPWITDFDKALGRPPRKTATKEFSRAAELFNKKEYKEAVAVADQALAAAERAGKGKSGALASLRFVRAAAYWNTQSWREAFDAAFDFLQRYPKDSRASAMCRRALQAGLKAASAAPASGHPPLDSASFLRFLRFATENFPDEPEIQKAPWYRAQMMIEAKEDRQAEQVLQAIRPDSPLCRHAQYGLALLAFRQAEAAGGPRGKSAAMVQNHLELAAAAVTRFAAARAPGAGDGSGGFPEDAPRLEEGIVHLGHAIARAFLDLPKPRSDGALALLDRLDASKVLQYVAEDERFALRTEAKVVAGGLEQVNDMIDKFVTQTAPESRIAQAVANIAELLERDWDRLEQAGKAAEAAAIGRKLVRIYQALLEQAGARVEGDILERKLNIRRRLGNCCLRLAEHAGPADRPQDYRAAIAHYTWVVQNLPEGKPKPGDVLRGLALAREETGQFADAIADWRTLARGLQAKSDAWYEANQHTILCVSKSGDRDRARKLLDYFLLRYPKIDNPVWDKRFKELAQELGKDQPTAPGAP